MCPVIYKIILPCMSFYLKLSSSKKFSKHIIIFLTVAFGDILHYDYNIGYFNHNNDFDSDNFYPFV